MFIRTMHFEVDPGKISEFWAEADTVRAKLKVIPGITHQFTAIQPNGDGLSIGIWETIPKRTPNAGLARKR